MLALKKNGAKVHQFLMNKFVNSSRFGDELLFISNLEESRRGEVLGRAAHEGVSVSLAVGHQSDLGTRDHLDINGEIEGGDFYP